MPLQSRFLSQIDVLSDKFIKVFKERGGQIGRRLQNILEPMAQVRKNFNLCLQFRENNNFNKMLLVTLCQDDVDLVRECIIKGLCVYLNEDPSNLMTEHVATDEGVIQQSIEETTMGIYIIKSRDASDSPEDIGIVLEGQRVLQDLDNCALAAAMLFGLMYTLNLTYPPELMYTFEVFQKLVMELEGNSLSKKALVLKNRLYE
uniref:Uncharacterized protein n=1 Tax=Astatotilapia calliptera TaxID=8154 RepID=A0AAX7UBG9_ASTCA